jgi:hypothetical protein
LAQEVWAAYVEYANDPDKVHEAVADSVRVIGPEQTAEIISNATTQVLAGEATGRAIPTPGGIVNRGGSFGDLNSVRSVNEVGHHIPQNAYNRITGLSRNDGPAVGMTVADHAQTRTFRGRGNTSMSRDAGLTGRQRLARDVRDIRRLFGSKYRKGSLEAIRYAKTLPQFKK